MILLCFEKGTFDICYSVLKIDSDDDGDNVNYLMFIDCFCYNYCWGGGFKSLCIPTASSNFR